MSSSVKIGSNSLKTVVNINIGWEFLYGIFICRKEVKNINYKKKEIVRGIGRVGEGTQKRDRKKGGESKYARQTH